MEFLDLSASTALAGPGQANVTKCPPVGQFCPFMSPRADWSLEDHSKVKNSVAPWEGGWFPGEHEAERLPRMYWKDTASGSLSCKTDSNKKL